MTRARRRIDEIGDESRRRILDAAEFLFAERGFDRTSFVDIAERSGISRGSIPWHFKTKDGLAVAVLERAVERLLPDDQYRTLPTLKQVLTDYIGSDYIGMLHKTGARLLLMILTEAMNSEAALHDQYSKFLAVQRNRFHRWLKAQRRAAAGDGDGDGATTQRERDLAVVIIGAIIGIQLQWQIDPASVSLERSMSTLASLVDGQIERLTAAATDEI